MALQQTNNLRTILLNSGIHKTNPALYQVINTLLDATNANTTELSQQITTVANKPAPAGGDVNGPGSATNNDLAAFDGTTGKLIKDSGILSSNVVTGPASATDTDVPIFDGSSGKLLKDSGFLAVNLARTNSSNNFSVTQILLTDIDLRGDFNQSKSNPAWQSVDTAVGPVDYRKFLMQNSGTALLIYPTNDAGSPTWGVAIEIKRSGSSQNTVNLAKGKIIAYSESALAIKEVAFSALVSSPEVGTLANISDSNTSTPGATVAGSGTNHILARFDGTNWICVI